MKDYLLGMHDNTAAVWTDTLRLNSVLNTVDQKMNVCVLNAT